MKTLIIAEAGVNHNGDIALVEHLTLDRAFPGPDHRASLEPAEFAAMVRAIREVELALGDGVKRPGTGISPMAWDALLGMRAFCAYDTDEPIAATELGLRAADDTRRVVREHSV